LLKVSLTEEEHKIDRMKGNNCNDWPKNLKEFHEEITKLPWNAFSCDPTFYFEDFVSNCFQTIHKFIQKINAKGENKPEILNDIELVIQIILMISLKTNNQTFILHQLEKLNNLQL
jgi:hypothetical protein